jgi:hypothetical protein
MASLFQRHGIYWIDYRVNGRRFRVSTGTTNKQHALVKLEDLKVKLFKREIGAKKLTGQPVIRLSVGMELPMPVGPLLPGCTCTGLRPESMSKQRRCCW